MNEYFAHDASGQTQALQSADEHCRNTAKFAADALEAVRLRQSAYLAGLIHDLGKFTALFQEYLLQHSFKRGMVNHTFAGVRFLFESYYHPDADDFSDMACQLLALAAGAHHGLFDCVDENRKNGFTHRLTKEGIGYEEAVENFFRFCADSEELNQRFHEAHREISIVLEKIISMTGDEAGDDQYFQETAFYSGLLARLLLSAVIEGDRRDTAIFMNDAYFEPKRSDEELEVLWGELLQRVEIKLNALPQTKPIDMARRKISDMCRLAADNPGGVFRLNVPTGGGKTLSGLRFALAHSCKHHKQRIIFVSPLLSILDQNAGEIRKYIQDDSLILEHHSNIIKGEEESELLDKIELLMETWESPIIITTLVQLLNTLFSGKTSAIRRFHSLCGSVIVIDEVQTVPRKMLSLFSLAVNFLTEICGATVVLCSATQPCVEQMKHPIHEPIYNIVPYDEKLWTLFKRTNIENIGIMSLEQIRDFALEKLKDLNSLLIICNTKSEEKQLYKLMDSGSVDLFALSADMCVAHRRAALDSLREALSQGSRKTVCVSTQVIEAGVDISFACVIRVIAGMDSVVQAAGRCNRSGEAGAGILAPVYIVQLANEKLSQLPEIVRGQSATRQLLGDFSNSPETYGGALDSDEAIAYYYRALCGEEKGGYHDFQITGKPTLFSLLSENERYSNAQPYYFHQAFKTAGSLFQVFEDNSLDVIVPYGRGEELIIELNGERAQYDLEYLSKLLEEAKQFSISLYDNQIRDLNREDALIPLAGGALGLSGHYNAEYGFSLKENNMDFLGVI